MSLFAFQTSSLASACLYHLAANPTIQDKLRKELTEKLPEKHTPITEDFLRNLPYLRAVIKEVLRISPPAVGTARKMNKDIIFHGYQVPKGTQVVFTNSLMTLQDYPRPNEFIPERWLRSTEGDLSHKHVHPFTFLPFGFGVRTCIGKRFANVQIEILLAKIVRNFQIGWQRPAMRFQQKLLYQCADPLKITVKEV